MIGRVPPNGFRKRPHASQRDESPFKIELARVGPGPLDRVEPFLGIIVTRIVLALRHAEHLELALVPADHQVDAEPARADLVGGHQRLGGDQRMEQRHMDGAEHGEAGRRRQQTGRPGDGFQRRAMEIGVAAITLPARDRQHEIEARRIRHAGKRQAVGPVSRPPLRYRRGGAAGGAIGAEQPDLKGVPVVHGAAFGQRCGAGHGAGFLCGRRRAEGAFRHRRLIIVSIAALRSATV